MIIVCMVILPMAAVNAVDSDYPYVDENPSVMMEDSLKKCFSVEKIDKVEYNYRLAPSSNGTEALVILKLRFTIDGEPYETEAMGNVYGYTLPKSGTTLWEGCISGEITIKDIPSKISIGFMQKESTGEVQFSVTLYDQSNGFSVISFGPNIMNGEVLDLINLRFGIVSNYADEDEEDEDTVSKWVTVIIVIIVVVVCIAAAGICVYLHRRKKHDPSDIEQNVS